MKYKELEKIAMKADYNITDGPTTFHMRNIYKNNDISVSKNRVNFIFINNEHCRPEDFEVIKAAMELAETPPEERQEEKKYYLRHRFLVEEGDCNYLNYDHSLRELNLSDIGQSKSTQTQFTKAEIEDIKEKYKTTLDDFEQIEAEK